MSLYRAGNRRRRIEAALNIRSRLSFEPLEDRRMLSLVSDAPTSVDLIDEFDTGISQTDDLTRLDNSDAESVLRFRVGGISAGATVTLLAGETVIGSAIGAGASADVTTDGAHELIDGVHSITAKQTELGKEESAASPALDVTVKTTAPLQGEQVAALVPGGLETEDYFGYSVAISGTQAVVGAYGNDDNGNASGAAYVYEDSGAGWVEVAQLNADDAAAGDLFGYSVAIDNGTVVVGAHGDDDNGGASGSVYLFEDNGSGWTQIAKLTSSDGAAGDYFGAAVAIGDSAVLVGAYGDDDAGSKSGSAYVFQNTGSSWEEVAKLAGADGAESDFFGRSVAIDNGTAIVGAVGDDVHGAGSGSIYVYEDSGAGWGQVRIRP